MSEVRDAALTEWHRNIVEGRDKDSNRRIKQYSVEGAGWSWWRRLAARILWRRAWCGFFAAWCYAQDGLSLAIRRKHLPSTYRLDRWCREDEMIRVALEDLRPGDILVVGHRKRYGDHICIVDTVQKPGSRWATIEGNAKGRLPGGTTTGRRDGVIRRVRTYGEARYGVRPLVSDYDEAGS
jgi:hypothetical protein